MQFRWMRAVLGSLLALHLGLAQASAVRTAAPCHDMTMPGMTSSGMTHAGTVGMHVPTPQHSQCCGDGLCHCSAASGFGAVCTATLIGVAPRVLVPRVDTYGTSQAEPALELRPPISC
jgi:hypothetical protein